jgi:uncharacterized protein
MRNSFIPFFPLITTQEESTDSDYYVITELSDLVRQNFLNLLLTSPGERIMDPEFGVGIKRYLFEMNTANTRGLIDSSIRTQVKKYTPFISIINIVFDMSPEQPNYIGIMISYSSPATPQQQNITIEVQDGNLRCR